VWRGTRPLVQSSLTLYGLFWCRKPEHQIFDNFER